LRKILKGNAYIPISFVHILNKQAKVESGVMKIMLFPDEP
jgi:hypothetical protein